MAALALAGAFAWLGVIPLIRTGTMMPSGGLSNLPAFAAIWTLMMAAMMLRASPRLPPSTRALLAPTACGA